MPILSNLVIILTVVAFAMWSQDIANGAEDQQRAPIPVNHVLAWPAPPGLETSKEYKVSINGVPVWVEHYEKRPIPITRTSSVTATSVRSTAWQSPMPRTGGPLHVEVQVSGEVRKPVLRPKSRGIKLENSGHVLRFTLPGPDQLYLEVEGLPPLCLFVSSPLPEPRRR